jgi:hypothetical protein
MVDRSEKVDSYGWSKWEKLKAREHQNKKFFLKWKKLIATVDQKAKS